ncbi:hypothetical protein D3C80_1661720 [compost metagenome]
MKASDTGEQFVIPAVEKLRNLGVIPFTAALAYIADEQWPEGLSDAAGAETEPEESFWITRQITAGLASAATEMPD